MIRCPQCGVANRDGSHFCNQCGAQLEGAEEQGPESAQPGPPSTPAVSSEVAALVDEQPWLRDDEQDEAPDTAPDEAPPGSVLAGLQDTLAAEPWTERLGMRQPGWEGSVPSPLVGSLPAPTAAELELLSQEPPLPAVPGEPLPAPRQRPTGRSPFWYGLLLLVLLLALTVEGGDDGTGWLMAVPGEVPWVSAAWETVDNVPAGGLVLVAWDFDPATSGEMALVADPLLRHLVTRNARLVTLSLLPAGPPLAQAQIARIIEEIGRQEPAIAAAQPAPVELGYVPGGDIALRAISQDPLEATAQALDERQLTAMQAPLRALDGVDLLLVLTAEADDGRAWVEQVTSYVGVRTVIGASGAAAPGLLPYYGSDQILGLVGGYDEALAYEALGLGQAASDDFCRNSAGQSATCRRMRAQFWGQLTLLLAVLVAPLAGVVNWLRGR